MNSSKQTKGKPITTSVPSIAIRFQAGGEEVEELYPSEDEDKSEKSELSEKSEKQIIEEKSESGADTNKHESSPMRDYLNKFGKRSSSIDTGINETTANTSDPWRLFNEFKGKLTKTVEEKLSEIKSKSNENENSPKHGNKNDKSKTNNSKENSSVSDSEEQSFSECSIPKSSGLNSTAEDIAMSSDDENSLAESDKTPTESLPKEMIENSPTKPKKHFFRQKNKETKSFVKYSAGKDSDTESQVKISSLTTVPEKDDNTPEDEVESGIEAYEEFTTSNCEILPQMIPDSEALIAPTGFFDKRAKNYKTYTNLNSYQSQLVWFAFLATITLCIFYLQVPSFVYGFIVGAVLTAFMCYMYFIIKLKFPEDSKICYEESIIPKLPILEIQAVKEYQPVTKFEGWINEYPEEYEPQNYHIMKTQTVFLKLEGNILRIYNTRSKIPKRAMWNESKHDVVFSHVRIYNLKSSKIKLLPTGLIPKRLWSKKYPICILLNKENMNEDINIDLKNDSSINPSKIDNNTSKNNEVYTDPLVANLVDAHIDEDEIKEMIADENDFFSDPITLQEEIDVEKSDINIITDDWDTLNLDESSKTETKLYFFTRTCRDKEEWYRRFVIASRDSSNEDQDKSEENLAATPNSVENIEMSSTPTPPVTNADVAQLEGPTMSNETGTPIKSSFVNSEEDYMRYMARFQQVHKTSKVAHAHIPKRKVLRFRKSKHNTDEVEDEKDEIDSSSDKNNVWLNFFIARIFYDVSQHDKVINRFLSLIQRKLSTIKLPYFIEDIVMTDLNLGKATPIVNHVYEPRIDERGLWIFMDIVYEGVTSMAIETKLNLMKLKEQAGKQDGQSTKEPILLNEAKSPIYNSDVEDSAESSDDDTSSSWAFTSTPNNSENNANSTPRKPSSTGGRKFLLMVDKIASSKYFQQATEIKYIKRAMEGVSNTEIKLSLEIQRLAGTLAVNIPSPPSDRVWIGFRGNPDLHLSAHPAFGERSINFMHVTKWIEKKLAVEFQKFFVLPNMEDFVLPVLIPKLTD